MGSDNDSLNATVQNIYRKDGSDGEMTVSGLEKRADYPSKEIMDIESIAPPVSGPHSPLRVNLDTLKAGGRLGLVIRCTEAYYEAIQETHLTNDNGPKSYVEFVGPTGNFLSGNGKEVMGSNNSGRWKRVRQNYRGNASRLELGKFLGKRKSLICFNGDQAKEKRSREDIDLVICHDISLTQTNAKKEILKNDATVSKAENQSDVEKDEENLGKRKDDEISEILGLVFKDESAQNLVVSDSISMVTHEGVSSAAKKGQISAGQYHLVHRERWKSLPGMPTARRLESQLDEVLETEERYWKQRAKIDCLRSGDRNTRFFHSKASAGKARNRMHGMMDDDGVWKDLRDDIEHIACNYFTNIYKTSNPSTLDLGKILDDVKPKLSQNISSFLVSSFTREKVRRAIFDMNPIKAPGSDGLYAVFFQKYMDSIGSSVVEACLSVLNDGGSVEGLNNTIIALIPKIQCPEKITDYRPISLCNVIYKAITKAVTNRLRNALEGLTNLMNKAQERGDISGFKCSRGGPVISHLFFADDSLIFTKANDKNYQAIRSILVEYEKASGHAINYEKSAICTIPSFSNTKRKRLASLIGITLVDCHEKYLRLSCFTGRSKRKLFSNIADRVWGKSKGWGEKLLSAGGKEVLVKTVIQAILSYTMTIFRLPKGLIAEIHRMCARFW
ncbi:hypothetical protein Dsin_026159 [Dipteronia sinensis]|uniref:Reverse transcriptase domain-containing protein n=1 Tax=Dipteronia sinensis TaxID=43782 RepID=A0AAD9ZY87_9ROSI|nr:hypothetical protein Dsin_026159 [Dipteronia sinensis]